MLHFELKTQGNRIGDEGAKMVTEGLKSNSTLALLSLDSDYSKTTIYMIQFNKEFMIENNIGFAGAREISEAMKNNSSLIELKLLGEGEKINREKSANRRRKFDWMRQPDWR